MAYGKAQQPMDFKWQVARKIDRLDMGEYSTNSRFNRLVVIFGLVRAIDPKESSDEETKQQEENGNTFRAIPGLIATMNERINALRTPSNKLKMSDESFNTPDTDIESQLDAFWYELAEVIYRCKITDNVRVSEEPAP